MISVALASLLTRTPSLPEFAEAFLIDPHPITVAPFPSYNAGSRLWICGKQMGLTTGENVTSFIPTIETS